MTLDEKLKIIGIRWLPSADKSVLKLIKIAANRLAKLEAQLAFANATVSALRGQLESTTAERDAAQEREVAYRNALMDAAKDFDQAGMGNCCQRVLDELNRIINAAEADHDHQ
jgi:uncharacterized coiled-coil protein SlyX